MILKTRLFTPGPTPLLPAAQFAMAAADVHHRTPEFRALYTRVLAQLKDFVGTANDVIVLSSSGTGAMEASVSNLTSPGDRVLVLSAGKFGERWAGLAKAFGCEVDLVSAPYGETFSLDAVKAALRLETRAVFMQATESSTGARHCLDGVAKLLKEANSEALLVVDAITGLGTTHIDMDRLGIDVLIGGSQKALMIPPGLSYLAISQRAWDRMESSYNPRYYFDLRKERKNSKNGESAYTPSVALIAALGAALDYIAKQAATPENPAGDLDRGAPRCGGGRQAHQGGGQRGPAGGGRDHRPRHDALRRGRLGDRRADRRVAEGGDDSAGSGLPEREREGVGGGGEVDQPALLLRPAQGAQERRQGRERVHAGGGAGCRAGRGPRLYCRAGGR